MCRFVQTYSRQSILFGRVEKQITCDIVNTLNSSIPGSESFSQRPTPAPRLQPDTKKGENSDRKSIPSGAQQSYEGITSTEDQPSSPGLARTIGLGRPDGVSQLNEESSGPRIAERATGSQSPARKKKTQVVSRKKSPRTRADKSPVLSIHGSASRYIIYAFSILNSSACPLKNVTG